MPSFTSTQLLLFLPLCYYADTVMLTSPSYCPFQYIFSKYDSRWGGSVHLISAQSTSFWAKHCSVRSAVQSRREATAHINPCSLSHSTAAKTARDSGVIQYAATASIDSRRLFYRSANLLLWYKGGEEKGKMKHKDCSVDQKREVEERKERKRQTDGQDERGTHRQRVWGE